MMVKCPSQTVIDTNAPAKYWMLICIKWVVIIIKIWTNPPGPVQSMQSTNAKKWKTKKGNTATTPASKSCSCYLCRLEAIGRNTEWHESYEKYQVGKRNKANEKQIDIELS